MAGEEQRSILEMSDEELLTLDPSTFNQTAEVPKEKSESNTDPEPENQEPEEVPEAVQQDPAPEQGAEDPEGGEGDAASQEEAVEEGSADKKAKGNEESTPTQKAADPTSTESTIDYKAAYDRLTAPFKANGRDIQVGNVEDAIALMQMGANYNKKMAALKPNLKLMKLLENNGLLNEEKLGYLIDLEKKNPDAIAKLIKDSGVDPLDLNTEKAGDYKPTQRKIDDREIELDTVLDEIQDTEAYVRTIDIVSSQWDGPSKQIIANAPQLLKVINGHVQSGVYDLISKEVEKERMFGRLSGLSDIEAYRQVGDAIQARNGFDHLAQPQGQQTHSKPVVVPPKPKMGDEDKRREKRLAASTSQPAASSQGVKADFNPLALSDDEFNKIVNQRLL